MKRAIRREKGITLVALVVTIIILLILAGVAIATVTGDNGLFRKAKEAVNAYKDSEANESQSLDYIAGQLEDLAKYDYNGYARSTMEMTVSDGTYYLPEGFKLAEDSGKTILEGIVVEDKNGNQYVWIPCYVDGGKGSNITNAIKYNRYLFFENQSFSEDGTRIYAIKQENVTESTNYRYEKEYLNNNSEEYKSIYKYGGYYVGRYETGDKESTEAKELRTAEKYSNNNTGNAAHKAVIKKGQAPYNWVTYEQAESLSNNVAKENGYRGAFTKLCSSYAWDTALKFIEKTNPSYPNENKKDGNIVGNYKNTSFNYIKIDGTQGLKEENSSSVIPTGRSSESVCNIFDMGGNVYELTTELSTYAPYFHVNRGGVYYNNALPAARSDGSNGGAYSDYGFRVTLYVK